MTAVGRKGTPVSRNQLVVSAVLTALAMVTLSACAGAGNGSEQYVEPANAAVVEPVAPAVAAPFTLTAVEKDGLGTIVTDQDGMTLYRYDLDSAEPPQSNCAEDCASTWLPVPAVREVRVDGLDDNVVGRVQRSDGSTQLTVAGWPAYRFTGDTAAGQTNGQDKGGQWHALTPQGGRAGSPARIAAADVPGFGAALTDQDGMTLYLFTKDTKAPSKATCADACADMWPPLLAADGLRVSGMDKALMGTVTRPDGRTQVTVGGWPVYRFTGDAAAGQTNGHGIGGRWFVIEPAGCKSSAPVAPQTPEGATETAQPDTGSGY